MSDLQWELYRLSVIETWPDTPYKAATLAAIRHRLTVIEQQQRNMTGQTQLPMR